VFMVGCNLSNGTTKPLTIAPESTLPTPVIYN
jgi:hypothetical protein